MEELWFVVSPQNPFKNRKSLRKRPQQIRHGATLKKLPKMRASNIEFSLPKPSYYHLDRSTYLNEKYPDYSFALYYGRRQFKKSPKWKINEK